MYIHFPELLVEYYDKNALYKIGHKVGKPIRVDFATNPLTRARYARVCIEINISDPLVSQIWVGNQRQIIRYKNHHLLCFHCGILGT